MRRRYLMNKFFALALTTVSFFSLFLCLWTTGRAYAEVTASAGGKVTPSTQSAGGANTSSFKYETKLASLDLIYEKTQEEEQQNKDSLDDKKTYNVSGGLRQIFGFIESADRITQVFVTGSARFQKSWFASVSQQLNFHYYNREPGKEDHLRLQDSLLYIGRTDKLPYNSSLKTNFSFSLPFSDKSLRNGTITEATASLKGNLHLDTWLQKAGDFKPAWLKNITFFAEGIGRYYLSPSTTPTKKQTSGGRPLPQFLFGVRQTGWSFNITDYVALSGVAGGWMIYPHKTYARDRHSPYHGLGSRPQIYYMFSLSSAFKFKQWTAGASYTHLDRYDKLGRREIIALDDRVSSWSVSVSYNFGFNTL